jgi:hypothetical protein
LGGYQLSELIGSGGIAEVYRGRAMRGGGREVAIKVIYPEFARQPGFLPNFRRIVDMTAKLASHPHILPLLASGEDNGYLYLITPYVSGGTLRDWLLHGGRLGVTDVAPFFRQLCAAVAYAHSLGVIHGNLKPSNIFLFEGRHVLLGDFGLLWDIRQIDMNHVGSGTEAVEYLAPEAFQGQITQAGDLYSLGAVLFATLVGHPPFSGLKPADIFTAHTQLPVPHLNQADSSLPQPVLALDSIIQRAMAKRPDERYPAAMQIAQAIDATLQPALPAAVAGPVPANSPAAQQAWSLGLQGGPVAPMAPGYPGAPGLASPPSGFIGGPMQVASPSGTIFAPLDPPFPPLAPSEQADAQMEVGRLDFGQGIDDAPPTAPTARVPAPRTIGEASSRIEGASDILTMRVPAPGQDAAAGYGSYAPNGAGWPPQGQNAWQPVPPYPSVVPGSSDQPWPGLQDENAQLLPAIRPGDAFPQEGWPDLDVPLGDGRYNPAGLAQEPYPQGTWGDGGQSADYLTNGYTDGSVAVPALPGATAGDHAGQGRNTSFSPTELGLPRLTMPELPEMAPGWEQNGDYGSPSSSSYYADGYSSEFAAAPATQYGESSVYPATGQWAGGESAEWSAQYPGYGQQPGQTGTYDSRDMQSFTDQNMSTNGKTALRTQHRPRLRNALMLSVVLLALLGGVLTVYAQPSICPISACTTFSTKMHKYVPSIGGLWALAPQPLSSSPSTSKIDVVDGKSATATLTLTNPNASTQTWQATADVSWVSISPATGNLPANGSATLTLTTSPASIAPGTYTPMITISVGAVQTRQPLTVVVSASARLSVSPSTLAYAACGKSQTLTVTNAGDGQLTYQATPSVSSALTLATSSQQVAPGAMANIIATLTCHAVRGQQYAINLTGNGSSMQVPVQYGA